MSDQPSTTVTAPVVTVPIKSAWLSKVNWTQAVSGAAMVLTFVSGGAIGLTADQQAALVVVIGVIGNVVTWVMKTFFTNTVQASSLPKGT